MDIGKNKRPAQGEQNQVGEQQQAGKRLKAGDGKVTRQEASDIVRALNEFILPELSLIVEGYVVREIDAANAALDDLEKALDRPEAQAWLDRGSLKTIVGNFRAVVTGIEQGGSAAKLWAGLVFKNELLAFSAVPAFMSPHTDAAQLKPVGPVTTVTGYRNSFALHGLVKPLGRFEEALAVLIDRQQAQAC